MGIDNPDNRPVPVFRSSQNLVKLYAVDNVLNSSDFNSDGQLSMKPGPAPDLGTNLQLTLTAKTRYQQQEPPTMPRATKPNPQVRVPLGPLNGNGGGGGGGNGGGAAVALAIQRGVGERVLGAEVANQEVEMAKLVAKLKFAQRESELLRKVLVGVIDLHMLTTNDDGA